jgi:hypothetical protein
MPRFSLQTTSSSLPWERSETHFRYLPIKRGPKGHVKVFSSHSSIFTARAVTRSGMKLAALHRQPREVGDEI